jgi:hypothetical protein
MNTSRHTISMTLYTVYLREEINYWPLKKLVADESNGISNALLQVQSQSVHRLGVDWCTSIYRLHWRSTTRLPLTYIKGGETGGLKL